MSKEVDIKYSKNELLKSSTYRPYIDLLACLLSDNDMYSEDDVNKMIDKALKHKEIKNINE